MFLFRKKGIYACIYRVYNLRKAGLLPARIVGVWQTTEKNPVLSKDTNAKLFDALSRQGH